MKETTYSKIWMADGILIFVYKPLPILDYSTAKIVVNERLHYQQDTSFPVLCDLQGIKDADKSSRDYLANEGSSLLKAVALVDTRAIIEALLRVYIHRSKPLIPTQLFENQYEAMHFLKSYR